MADGKRKKKRDEVVTDDSESSQDTASSSDDSSSATSTSDSGDVVSQLQIYRESLQSARREIADALGVAEDDPAVDQAIETQGDVYLKELMPGAARVPAESSQAQAPTQTTEPAVDPYAGMTMEQRLEAQRLDLLKQEMDKAGITDEMVADGYSKESTVEIGDRTFTTVFTWVPDGKAGNTSTSDWSDGGAQTIRQSLRDADGTLVSDSGAKTNPNRIGDAFNLVGAPRPGRRRVRRAREPAMKGSSAPGRTPGSTGVPILSTSAAVRETAGIRRREEGEAPPARVRPTPVGAPRVVARSTSWSSGC